MTPDEIARMPLDEVIMSLSVRSDVLSRDALHYLRAAEARGYERAREQAAGIADEQAKMDIFNDHRGFCRATSRTIATSIRAMEPEG